MCAESSLPTIPIDRSAMLRGRRTLDLYFKEKRNLRLPDRAPLLFSYRLEEGTNAGPMKLIVLTPKRSIRSAHDRKKLRRWTLEALRTDSTWRELFAQLKSNSHSLTVSVLHTLPPSQTMNWLNIQRIVATAGAALTLAMQPKLEQRT